MTWRRILLLAILTLTMSESNSRSASANEPASTSTEPKVIGHSNIYAKPKRFGGWPANHGIWNWKDEILVGFSMGDTKDLGPDRHAIDRERPEEYMLARSLDGGKTWSIENPAEKGAIIPYGKTLHGIAPPWLKERPWTDCPGGIDFTDPNFIMTLRMTDHHIGPSRFYTSMDRGKNWEGPYRLNINDQNGRPIYIAARTSYIVNGPHDCTVFLTAGKADREEGRIFCARTTDGAKSWKFLSWIGEEPKGYAIMPSAVRLGDKELLVTIRCRFENNSWIEAYRSIDDGLSWKFENIPVPDAGEGNPPSLIKLADGRLSLSYGLRKAPFEMQAILSEDGGRTWGKVITLRGHGGGRDIGYPASVQRPDGKIVTTYYFHDEPTSDRYVAATIWDPGLPSKQGQSK